MNISAKFLAKTVDGFLGQHLWRFLHKHLIKKDPQGEANFDPRDLIKTFLVELYYTMLSAEFKNSGPCSFWEEAY